MLIVMGIITVPPSHLAAYVADLASLARTTRRRDGNLFYDTAVLDAGAGRLLVAERWRDREALSAHLDAEETAAFVTRWQALMHGDVRVYDAGNERPLSAWR